MVEDASSSERLARECRVFCRYLAQQPPNAYVLRKYVEANRALGLPTEPGAFLDRALLKIGVAHPWLARLADAYARFLQPRSIVRVKLVLLVAILESSAPTEALFRPAAAVPRLLVGARLFLHAVTFTVTFAAAVLLFLPFHLAGNVFGRRSHEVVDRVAALERP